MKFVDKTKRIKNYWNFLSNRDAIKYRNRVNMGGLALMHEYYNYLVTGSRENNYLEYFWNKYFKGKNPRVASLGCGNGHLERNLARFKCAYSQIDGYEINPTLVDYANQEARTNNFNSIRYFKADLNNLTLKISYDLIIFFHSLHHVENLEACLDSVKSSLSESGIVLVVDFVGPSRFQWTDSQIFHAQSLLDLLPEELKIDCSSEKKRILKTKIERQTVEYIVFGDPSEAVRSSDIMETIKNRFSIVEYKPMGGTILNLLFHNIAGNFKEDNLLVMSLILSFQKFEETLIKESILPSDFVFLVLKK